MRIRIELPESSQEILVQAGTDRRLTDILRGQGIPLNTRCGERNLCAGCIVELVSGSLQRIEDGDVLTTEGEIQACRYRPLGEDLVVRIPQRSRLSYQPQVLDSYRINVPYAHDPLRQSGLGAAVDVGTTTVALEVFELSTGKHVAKASGFNKQMHYGDDVLTRINLCSTDIEMLGRMRGAIIDETIQPLLWEALGDHVADVVEFSIAGNTTMLHLLVGSDPTSIGVAPFSPSFLEMPPFLGREIGLHPENATVQLLPSIAAYIGADLTAGLFSSGLLYDEGPSLLVDVGTNGEILLNHQGSISGCATAAGPAFEGSGLTSGIRAGAGAICGIRFAGPSTDLIEWQTIGNAKPCGICGSAYVDFLAEARRAGIVGPTGRIVRPGPKPSEDPKERARQWEILETGHGRAFRIAFAQGRRPILITEADIAKLLQAKAAIAAGILTLLRRKSLAPSDVRTLYLAGGFGMHLVLEHAIRCGLLPCFEPSQIQLVGNTSLAGAALNLIDKNVYDELKKTAKTVETVELNLDPGFEDEYLDQLSLP